MSSILNNASPDKLSGRQIQPAEDDVAKQPPLPPELQPIDVRRERHDEQTAPSYVPLNPHKNPHGHSRDAKIDFQDPNFRAGLPSRDYPVAAPDARQLDKEAYPTFVPPPKESAYSDEYMRRLRGAPRGPRLFETDTSLLIEQLQIPILLGLLFFVFNLPFARELVRRQFGGILPIADETTLALNVNGIALMSALFAAAVHFGFG